MKNTLIKGDNIDSLVYIRDKMKLRESIDLVYIDPPFATGGEFKTDSNGRVATISSSSSGKIAYSDKLTGSAFIEFLRERQFAVLARNPLARPLVCGGWFGDNLFYLLVCHA